MNRLEVLTCDICKRVGTIGYRDGSKPGAVICTNRRACSRRAAKWLRGRGRPC